MLAQAYSNRLEVNFYKGEIAKTRIKDTSGGSGTNFMTRDIEFKRPQILSIEGLWQALVRLTGDKSINVRY
jgi:hypothetical protein